MKTNKILLGGIAGAATLFLLKWVVYGTIMNTVELKNILIQRIAGINDKSFLNAIKTIIETKSESIIYKTTPEQRQSIKAGRDQIARGEYQKSYHRSLSKNVLILILLNQHHSIFNSKMK